MITVRDFGEFPIENAVNCGSGEWDKVRVYKEEGETVVETENRADPKQEDQK